MEALFLKQLRGDAPGGRQHDERSAGLSGLFDQGFAATGTGLGAGKGGC